MINNVLGFNVQSQEKQEALSLLTVVQKIYVDEAKGLEMIIPVISSYTIEHMGEIKDADIAEIIKGSVLSLACNEYFGHSHYFKIPENPKAKAQIGKIMIRLKNDPTIDMMIKNEIKSSAFNTLGRIDFNNKNLAKNLEEMYDRLVPTITDCIKNMRFD